MTRAASLAFAWLVPGGGYLLQKRYAQFALAAILVTAAFAIGLALQGGNLWPTANDLSGLDGFTALVARAGAFGKMLAGAPYLLARLFAAPRDLFSASLNEYGTTLLTMAGLLNALAIAGSQEKS